MHFLPLLSFLGVAFGQFSFDDGLKRACEIMKGQFVQRDPPNDQATVGDRCSMTFQTMTVSEEDAAMFCRLNAPWRLNKAIPGKKTTCEVEATLMCKAGWKQMFGHCFSAPGARTRYTRAGTEKVCKDHGAQVTTLHHKYHVGVFKKFFSDVSQTWIRINEAYEPYTTVLKKGGSPLLAFTGKTYTFFVHHNSLVRVDPSLRFQVICEYEPPRTLAEVNYLAKRYEEIYHKTVAYGGLVLVRSASHYTSGRSNVEICRNVLKPFKVDFVQPFIADKKVLTAFDEAQNKNGRYSPMVTRSGAEIPFNAHQQKSSSCSSLPSAFIVRPHYKSWKDFTVEIDNLQKTCDSLRSLAFVHRNNKAAAFRSMSDSFAAPVWCKLGRKKEYRRPPTPPGYELFERANGRLVAHRLQQISEYDGSQGQSYHDNCRRNGDDQSGFESWEELRLLVGLLVKGGHKYGCAYTAGVRTSSCAHLAGFDPEDGKICSRNNVNYFQFDAAVNRIKDDMWWNRNGIIQPYKGKRIHAGLQICRGQEHDSNPNLGYLSEIEEGTDTTAIVQKWYLALQPQFCQKTLTIEEIDD